MRNIIRQLAMIVATYVAFSLGYAIGAIAQASL